MRGAAQRDNNNQATGVSASTGGRLRRTLCLARRACKCQEGHEVQLCHGRLGRERGLGQVQAKTRRATRIGGKAHALGLAGRGCTSSRKAITNERELGGSDARLEAPRLQPS